MTTTLYELHRPSPRRKWVISYNMYTCGLYTICLFTESTEFDGDLVSPTVAPSGPSEESIIPVAIVTQSSLDVLLTGPTGTATTTIEITTPSLE